jgi:Vacuolar sorting 38 and autophagy-related subunit 14
MSPTEASASAAAAITTRPPTPRAASVTPTRKRRGAVPHPVTVEIHNLFPKVSIPQKQRRWYRPDHSIDLLCSIRMEVVVVVDGVHENVVDDEGDYCGGVHGGGAPHDDKAGRSSITTATGKERTVYSETDCSRTILPCWKHLNDSIRDFSLFESMRARFFAVDRKDTSATSQPCFLEVSLHPSKLCRIAALPTGLLPLNCAVVYFSDHSIRVHPAQYQLLLESQQERIVHHPLPTSSSTDSKPDPYFLPSSSRFEETAFSALGDGRNNSLSALSSPMEEIADAFREVQSSRLLLPQPSTSNGYHHRENGRSDDNSPLPIKGEDDPAILSPEQSSIGSHCPTVVDLFDDDDIDDKEACEDDCYYLELLAEQNKALGCLIRDEENALAEEMALLEVEKSELRDLCDQIQLKDEHDVQLQLMVEQEMERKYLLEFRMEAQRIRLLRELAVIYPVTISDDRRFLIRGLEIPQELNSSAVPENVVSAALGFLCHTVVLMSKYLGVHLSHRLHFQSSRSAVQSERGTVYPLFQGRPVEREQLAFAVHLLDMNIECICKARGIRLAAKLHMLAKVKRIYEQVIDGY